MERLKKALNETPDEILPSCAVYAYCLDEICRQSGIRIKLARQLYGGCTAKQWRQILKIN